MYIDINICNLIFVFRNYLNNQLVLLQLLYTLLYMYVCI